MCVCVCARERILLLLPSGSNCRQGVPYCVQWYRRLTPRIMRALAVPYLKTLTQIPPLCLAAATGSLPVLAALRSKGGELDPAVCVDSLRRNALHYAAAKGEGGRRG